MRNNVLSGVKMFVLIPAYCPDEKLLSVVSGLMQNENYRFVVVDDGSGGEYAEIFKVLTRGEYQMTEVDGHESIVNGTYEETDYKMPIWKIV